MNGNERAVSPVVGVMLMLSVTIIIAAVVSAAAGGLSGTEKKAPGAILDVTIYSNRSYGDFSAPAMVIKHISGAVLATRDLQLVTYYQPTAGTPVKGNLSGEHIVQVGSSTYYPVLFINDPNRFTDLGPLAGSAGGESAAFGNASATLGPGDILITPPFESDDSKHPSRAMEYLFPGVDFSNPKNFTPGSVVTVKVIHSPSGKIIFDKDVVVL